MDIHATAVSFTLRPLFPGGRTLCSHIGGYWKRSRANVKAAVKVKIPAFAAN
jgi:hypothetical protein